MPQQKFDGFYRHDYTYANFSNGLLRTSVLVPETAPHATTAKRPIIVFFHGGGFVVGGRMYEQWFPTWLIEMAIQESAIVMSPDYRLWPEVEPGIALDDVAQFWNWLRVSFPDLSKTWQPQPDCSRILCTGQSSGGRLALQSTLLSYNTDIKAVISMSAPLHADIPPVVSACRRPIMGRKPRSAQDAQAAIEKFIKSKIHGTVMTERDPVANWSLVMSLIQEGWYSKLLGARPEDPWNLEQLAENDSCGPAIVLIHGRNDTVAPVESVTKFARNMRQIQPARLIDLIVRPGDHIFDVTCHLKEPWLQTVYNRLVSTWLRDSLAVDNSKI